MPSTDNHLLINLIMIELLGTVFFLSIVTVWIYIRRYFVRKSLTGYKVLITNGHTSLSQELAKQLVENYKCHVVLVKGRKVNESSTNADIIFPNVAGISVLHCDILENDELERLSGRVQESFGGIDIVIDNATMGIFEAANKNDCRAFIDVTSGKLRTTINMLMHFIPKMKYSNCGHFISIQPVTSNPKPLLSSYREIKELINVLTDNQQSYALHFFNRQKINVTTVLWNCENSTENSNEHNNNSDSLRDIKQIAERILNGIRCDRQVVNVENSTHSGCSIRNSTYK